MFYTRNYLKKSIRITVYDLCLSKSIIRRKIINIAAVPINLISFKKLFKIFSSFFFLVNLRISRKTYKNYKNTISFYRNMFNTICTLYNKIFYLSDRLYVNVLYYEKLVSLRATKFYMRILRRLDVCTLDWDFRIFY